MTLKQENSIILGTFVVLLAGVLGINISTMPARIPVKIAGSAQGLPIITNPAPKEMNSENKKIESNEGAQEVPLQGWGRDPFISSMLQGTKQAITPAGSGLTAGELTVILILIGETKRVAAINNKIFQEGDMVQGEKIMRIRGDGVVLGKNGMTRLLPLRKPAVQLSEEKQNVKEK